MQKVTPSYLRANPLPEHDGAADKQERGRVLVIAGSVEIPGAALLAAVGALRAGAGVLQVATCQSAAGPLRMAMPEAMVVGCGETPAGGIPPSEAVRLGPLARDCDAVLIGPGMVDDEAVAELTLLLLGETFGPHFVLDAQSFVQMRRHLEVLKRHRHRLVTTPHSGEMAKFLNLKRDVVDRDPNACAQQASEMSGAVVALKGAETHIVSPSGKSWLCDHGCVGLATSGSGDTLAGILAGLLARGAGVDRAACWSVFIHAEAGQRLTKSYGRVGFLAREIPQEVPRIMEDLQNG